MRPGLVLAAALSAALFGPSAPLVAKDESPAEVDAPEKVKPGQTALCKAPQGMRYFLRVPKSYDAKTGARLVVFLHGSNMNGLTYVRSFEAKHWAQDDVLCCPNGETGTDPLGSNNFTQESAPLVADVAQAVKKAFKTTISYCGGHSQGGFLTYSVVLSNPDLFQGALPMSSDCWLQNEPNLWETEPEVAKTQHEIAIAVLHSKNDPVVPFEQGRHAYDVFRDEGWQKLRFFTPEKAAHMFMLFPVDEMLDWLDAMNGRGEEKTAKLMEKWAKDGEWGWVLAAAKASKAGPAKWTRPCEDAAAKALPVVAEAMKGAPADWIPKLLEFWRVHGGTDAAKPLLDDYLAKRAEQRDRGRAMFLEAVGLRRSGKEDEAVKTFERILVDAPCSYEAYYGAETAAEKAAPNSKKK